MPIRIHFQETIFLYEYICQEVYTRGMKDARLTTLEDAFKAFADPTRLRILGLLAGGDICVCNIHECLGISQPAVSRHLDYLRKKRLVATRTDGLWVNYQLAGLRNRVLRVALV